MASGRIKGITIEIGGDTTKLTDSLKKVDSSLKDTQAKLKDVNKLLKLDPTNVDLLRQKHDLLSKAVTDTKKRQEELQKALEQLKNAGDTEKNREQQDALQRELIETTSKLKDLEAEFAKSHPVIESFSESAKQVAEKTKTISKVAAGAAAGMVAMAIKSAASADDLLTMSNVTGLSVEELQKLQYASSFVDVSLETMTGSITKLTKNMASGSDAFDTLGVSITNTDGSMRDATDVWYDTIEALGNVANETERDQLSMELFGKSAMEMAGIVDDGGAALKSFGEEAENTGLIMGQDAVESAVAFNDQMDKLKNTTTQAFFKMGSSLATSLLPMIENLVNAVVKVVTWFGNLDGGTQTVILTLLGMVAAISPVASLLGNMNTIVTVGTTVMGALSGAGGVLGGVFTFLTGPVGLAIAAFAALVAGGVLLYKNWDKVMDVAKKLGEKVSKVFANIKKAVSTAMTAAKNAVSSAMSKMTSAISGSSIVSAATTTFNNVKSAINTAFEGAKSIVANALAAIKSTIDNTNLDKDVNVNIYENTYKNTRQQGTAGDISWNARGYDEPLMFTRPTVLATPLGLQGFGDRAGSELVVGTDKLMSMISAASGGMTINMVINGAQGQSVDELADKVSARIQRQVNSKKGVYR